MSKPVIPPRNIKLLDARGMQIPSNKIGQVVPMSKKLNTPMEGVEKAFKGIQDMLGDHFRLTFVIRHETAGEDGIVLTTDELEAVAHLCLIQQTRAEKAAAEEAGQTQ